MADHAAIMQRLYASRERRQLKFDVARLPLEKVRDELFIRELNEEGDAETIRDRLARALMREIETDSAEIPWYGTDVRPSPPSADESTLESGSSSVHENAEPTIVHAEVHETPLANANIGVAPSRVAPSEHADSQLIEELVGSSSGASTYVPPASASRIAPTPVTRVQTIAVPTAMSNVVTTTSAATTCQTTVRWSTPAIARTSEQPPIIPRRLPPGFQQAEYGFYAGHYLHMAEFTARENVPLTLACTAAPRPLPRTNVAPAWQQPEVPREPVRTDNAPRTSEPSNTQRFTTAQDWDNLSPIPNVDATQLSQSNREEYGRVARDFSAHFNQSRARELEQSRLERERARVELARKEAELADKQREIQQLRDQVAEETRKRERAARRAKLEQSRLERERAREPAAKIDKVIKKRTPISRGVDSSDSEVSVLRGTKRRSGKRVAPKGDKGIARESTSSSEGTVRGDPSPNARRTHKGEAVKLLRSWGLRYAGEDREDAEEFLEQLEDCRKGSDLSEREILTALPCVLAKRAARWYRTLPSDNLQWSAFARAFKHQFIGEYDREDLMDDLRRRTQAKGEPIATYLSNFRYIVSRFAKPPKERKLVDMAYRNLLPEYRRAMSERVVVSLDEMEDFGRRWEKQKELDSRYIPPPSADKMRVPGAAFTGARNTRKIASVETEVAATTSKGSTKTSEKPKRGRGGKKKTESGKSAPSSDSASDVRAVDAIAQAPITPKPRVAPPEKPLYANVARDNAPSSGLAPPPPRRDWRQRSWGVASRQQVQQPAQNYTKTSSRPTSPQPSRFVGPCFTCQAVGHRASECPEMRCFFCGKKGHPCRECPSRNEPPVNQCSEPRAEPRVRCQACGTIGVTVRTCPKCGPLFAHSGNEAAGGQR